MIARVSFLPQRATTRISFTPLMLFCCGLFVVLNGCSFAAAQGFESDQVQSVVWQRSHALMLENIGFFLDGAVEVDLELGKVQWKMSEAAVSRKLERIVQEVASLQSLSNTWINGGFSQEVKELIHYVAELDHRDLRRWRMAENLSDEEQWYVLVQSGLDELKMQLAMELNYRVNAALFEELKGLLAEEEIGSGNAFETDWLALDTNAPLPALAVEMSLATADAISAEDRSIWPRPETPDLTFWMERILFLLEDQDRRIQRMELGEQGSQSVLRPIQSDPSLNQLRLPQAVDVRFASGSVAMDLSAQLELNEVMELLCRYPQIRVVCTGHADAIGGRAQNHLLSKNRARAVRDYILQTGLDGDRVLLNYFGEERLQTSLDSDRRVEIQFYVE